ncbi:MAG: hypothetical protein WD801_05950 [Gemmatimonadaceae bacterium]
MSRTTKLPTIATGLALMLAMAACDSSGPGGVGQTSVTAGLSEGQSNDTTPTPPSETNPTPGSFHGFVFAHSGMAPDTVAFLADVVVSVYPLIGRDGSEPIVGPLAASVVSDDEGAFTSPTLDGGEYIVTLVPPQGSPHRGVFVHTTVSEVSSSGYWWVMLPPL